MTGLRKDRAVRVGLAIALAACAAFAGPVLAESSKDDWFDEECVPKVTQRWCAPRLTQGGWKLKYQTRSPEDQTDVFWLIEVWVKGADALVCEFKGGRNGARSNGCYSLSEVAK